MKKPASRLVHPPAERILPQRFWSSDKLTGSQTEVASSEDERSVLEQWQTDWWSDKRLIRSLHALVLVR